MQCVWMYVYACLLHERWMYVLCCVACMRLSFYTNHTQHIIYQMSVISKLGFTLDNRDCLPLTLLGIKNDLMHTYGKFE